MCPLKLLLVETCEAAVNRMSSLPNSRWILTSRVIGQEQSGFDVFPGLATPGHNEFAAQTLNTWITETGVALAISE
jgi:hypothetical protein